MSTRKAMSGFHTSATDTAVVCLRVMRRLLQDEEVALAQLSYLIENIHDPLAQTCLPPSQRPIPPSLSPSCSQLNSHSVPGTRQHCVKALARTLPMSTEGNMKLPALHQSPQPSIIVPQGSRTVSYGTPPRSSKHGPNPITRNASAKPPAPQLPLTFSQYWDLFANLPTLYAVQLKLVQQLEGIIQRLLVMVDELQPPHETAIESAPPLPDDVITNAHPNSNASNPAAPNAHAATAPTSTHGSGSTRKHVSALRFPTLGSIPNSRSVCGDIGVMVNEFFGSELMRHYMAEHLMYTVKYTQRAAPQLLRLSRVWRWTGGAAAGVSGVPTAALTNLSDADRTMLLQYALFLDFLWRSFGRDGIAQDSRVCLPRSVESLSATGQAPTPMETANARPLSDPAGTAGGGNTNSGQRRIRTTTAAASTGSTVLNEPAGKGRSALPPIPAMWEGFRTILALLATPLSGLRRYSHVARCLIESGTLQQKDRDRLQESFIDVVALRMSEETNLVMEELWTHDVEGIMALMDMPGSRAVGDKTVPQASPRRAGTASASAAGGSGAGVAVSPTSGALGGGSNTSSNNINSSSLPSADCSNRALIHYGRLSKRFGRGRHERLAFLFSDWMCYVEECSNGRFRVRGTIPLTELSVVEVHDEEASDAMYGFELLSPHLPKRLIFFASSPEQRGQWVDAIRYTVRRFAHQHPPNCGGTNTMTPTSVANSSVVAPAVTMSETGLPSVMRGTAPMLPAQSRLSRQRRHDSVWQDYVDAQRRTAESLIQTSPVLPEMSSHSLGGTAAAGGVGGGVGSLSSTGNSPPPPANLSGDVSRDSSFAGGRPSSTHRQLEYDVTPWSQHGSLHRRIRSQDLFAAHQQQQQQQLQATVPSSNTASPMQSTGTRLNANLSARTEEVERTAAMHAGGVGSVPEPCSLNRAASLPGSDEEVRTAGNLSTPLLLSPGIEESPGKSSFHRRCSSLLQPALFDALGSVSTRVGSSAGLGTPLRRPVSERFEVVKNMGSSNQESSPTQQQQQQQLHRSSTSFIASSSSPNPPSSALGSDSGLTRAVTTRPPTAGTGPPPSQGKTSERRAAGGTDTDADVGIVEEQGEAPTSLLPLATPAGEEERIFLEGSMTELSAPVEGNSAEIVAVAEDEEESESALDGSFEEESEGKKARRLSHCLSGLQPLYRDVLNDTTTQQAPKGEAVESSHVADWSEEEEESDSSNRGMSMEKLDCLIHNSPTGGCDHEGHEGSADDATTQSSERYDDDLHNDNVSSQGSHPEKESAAGTTKNTNVTGPTPLWPQLDDHEKNTAPSKPRLSGDQRELLEAACLGLSVADRLKNSIPLDKVAEDEDTATAVVTAFRCANSPALSVMSPISPGRPDKQQQLTQTPPSRVAGEEGEKANTLDTAKGRGASCNTAPPSFSVLTTSREQNSRSQSTVPINEKSLPNVREAGGTQRIRHVDPVASESTARSKK